VITNDQLVSYCPRTLEEVKARVDGELRLLKLSPPRRQNAMRQSGLYRETAQVGALAIVGASFISNEGAKGRSSRATDDTQLDAGNLTAL
jgi:hypothetical protein